MMHIRNERGVVLMVSLLVLVMLTLIGLAAIMNTTTEINIASNQKQATQALYLAEAGINAVKGLFENPASFTPGVDEVVCMDTAFPPDYAYANCAIGAGLFHTSARATHTFPSAFFDKRRVTADNAQTYIMTGTDFSQFLDVDGAGGPESNNAFDDGGSPLDANGAVAGDYPAMWFVDEDYINDTLLNGAFVDMGTVTSIGIFPPSSVNNYAMIRVVAEAGGSVRVIEQEIGPSLFIPITAGTQAGSGGGFNGNGRPHWGEFRVERDPTTPFGDPTIEYNNTNFIPCNYDGCTESTVGWDKFFEIKVEGWVDPDGAGANVWPNPDGACADPITCDHPSLSFDVFQNEADITIDQLDYTELKDFAKDNDSYYVVCDPDAGSDPVPSVNTGSDDVIFQGFCGNGTGVTFEALTDRQTYDLIFLDWEGATDNTAGFTMDLSGDFFTDGNLYINGNFEWSGGGSGESVVMEDPDGVDDPGSLKCQGLADQVTCAADIQMEGLLYTTGNFGGSGSPVIYGALVAEGGVQSSGTPDIYYNADLRNGLGNLPRTSKQLWREIR